MSAAPQGTHRRYNPLLDEWVLCSVDRMQRPWQGQVETPPADDLPAYDPACYLCPGNARAAGQKNPYYEATYAFDNDFPALVPGGDDEAAGDGLIAARGAPGICRVVCFSPRHDLTLARMDERAVRRVVDAWADEVQALAARGMRHVQVFENKGEMMGCSNPHPHGQVWATAHLPTGAARRLESQRRYQRERRSDLLGDYLERELASGERVVFENTDWVALVPFWAVWPFETMLLPRRRAGDLPSLDETERRSLADALCRLNRRYDNLFRCSFPYSMAWHARPADGRDHSYWRLHASWYPPLLRSATVRKFLVGYELAAEPQRDLSPEEAAARLRAASDVHYRDG